MQARITSATRGDEREPRDARFAMRLSLIVGLAMLIGKTTIYFMTHSAAIFSDAAESVVHVIAVGCAAFSLRLRTKSASPQFLYGYERITFFSAGFEGAMIIVAAVAILIEAIRKWNKGLPSQTAPGQVTIQRACGAWLRQRLTSPCLTVPVCQVQEC
jgi:cation diffusion facilitator family transporter